MEDHKASAVSRQFTLDVLVLREHVNRYEPRVFLGVQERTGGALGQRVTAQPR